MKKIKFFLLFSSLLAITSTNNCYGLSIHRPIQSPEKYEPEKYLKISDLVNVSAKQLSELTGKKMNILEKLSFKIMKIKMKHDLKKNPNLRLKDYYGSGSKKHLSVGGWILAGILALVLLLLIGFILTNS